MVFTGGEATLFMDQLLEGIGLAHERGFHTRLVTNPWWARTYERAKEVVGRLREAGLDELNISYDRFHDPWLARFGGFNNVINAARVAREAGITLVVAMLRLLEGPQPDYDSVKAALVDAGLDDVEVVQDIPSALGRATSLPENILPKYELPEIGCSNSGSTLTIMPNGDAMYYCGHTTNLKEVSWFYRLGNTANSSVTELVNKVKTQRLGPGAEVCGACPHIKGAWV